EAIETLLPIAEKRGVVIEDFGDITPAVGSAALLLQMTTNLVHNAIVHNLPEHGTVWVDTRVHPGTVVLTVENSGEVLSPQLVSRNGGCQTWRSGTSPSSPGWSSGSAPLCHRAQ